MMAHRLTWRKSRRSNDAGGNCVEVTSVADRVGVRDSTVGETGPVLWLAAADWEGLLALTRPE